MMNKIFLTDVKKKIPSSRGELKCQKLERGIMCNQFLGVFLATIYIILFLIGGA